MNSPLRIGDPVQVHTETEVLTLIALDGDYAWVRDGAGRPQTRPFADLQPAKSRMLFHGYQPTMADLDEARRRDRYDELNARWERP